MEAESAKGFSLFNEMSLVQFLTYEGIYAMVALLLLFFAYRMGFFTFNSKSANPFATGFETTLTFMGIFSTAIFLPYAVQFLNIRYPEFPAGIYYWLGPVLQMSVASFFAYLFLSRQKREFLDLNKIKSFSLGVITWFLVYPQFLFVVLLFAELGKALFPHFDFVEQDPVKQLLALKDHPLAYYGTIFAIIIGAPVIEEILFRGFLQGWLKSKVSLIPAIGITSLIFALLHVSQNQGLTNLVLVPALFLLSCYLGYLYEREKTLAASIGLHMAFNSASILYLLFQ